MVQPQLQELQESPQLASSMGPNIPRSVAESFRGLQLVSITESLDRFHLDQSNNQSPLKKTQRRVSQTPSLEIKVASKSKSIKNGKHRERKEKNPKFTLNDYKKSSLISKTKIIK
ncbi:hypothetical protein O181_008460 [Austropuccinia psidii MF-1]|uniref:Uncharacterized protein n=1 Tax=Austropuccinia psidii MF-1 TaxID=1389203 RepID=A0A9Q3GIX1_9BASI|nr:hypothetical protein [Austropuccinia psidii MF-1]